MNKEDEFASDLTEEQVYWIKEADKMLEKTEICLKRRNTGIKEKI